MYLYNDLETVFVCFVNLCICDAQQVCTYKDMHGQLVLRGWSECARDVYVRENLAAFGWHLLW
jgi:predicted nucleic acid-binding Zn finger protein